MAPSKCPRWLKVLCILTFIGIVIELVMIIGTWQWLQDVGVRMQSSVMAESEISMEISSIRGIDNPLMFYVTLITTTMPNVAIIVSCISPLLCFLGALQMWKLKKVGFYIYIVGECVVLVSPVFIIILSILMESALYATFFLLLKSILFIILYRLSLKHML